MSTWQEDTATYLKLHEGVINHFYLDVVGLVTVGVGYMVPNPEAASRLLMQHRPANAVAGPADLQAEWGKIHDIGQPAKPAAPHTANFYKPFTTLVMPDAEIDRLLQQTIAAFAVNLRGRFNAFDTFPNPACMGCMDMIYSLGPQGFFHGFPRMCEAVDRKDWVTAAGECQRANVSPQRNADLRKLFIDAAA